MNTIEIIAIIGLVGYAIYKQTRRSEVPADSRFKLAIIYGIVGIAVGGFTEPHGATAIALLAASIALSVVIGLVRGYRTRVWMEPDGRVLREGTALTVGLFLLLITAKFGMGIYAYFNDIQAGGFGEIMVMMALMVAAQAQIIHTRARTLTDAARRVELLA